MRSENLTDTGERIAALLKALGGLSVTLAAIVGSRSAQAAAAYRSEVRAAATVLALAGTAVFFVCAAAAFAAVSVLAALWGTHPVLAAGLVATGFALLAVLAVVLLRLPPAQPR